MTPLRNRRIVMCAIPAVAGMLRRGVPRQQVVEETSALYGIPEECVEEVVAAVPA